MLTVIITAWEEPLAVKECIKRFLNQSAKVDEILITCPDEETKKSIMEYIRKYPKKIKFELQDYKKNPKKKNKNFMLNLLGKKAKGDILIFTDGDIFVEKNCVKEILKQFKNEKIGAVCGHPIPSNPKTNILGYWSHLLTYGAHRIRKERANKQEFLECSGYLYAIRNKIIKDIPMDVAEDSVMPLLFWQEGYKIGYAENAIAYVKFPTNLKQWIKQKTRVAKSHELLDKYGDIYKMKSFKNEVLKGTFWALGYAKNLREFFWTLLLFLARLYIWIGYFYETKIRNIHYGTWDKIKVRQ